MSDIICCGRCGAALPEEELELVKRLVTCEPPGVFRFSFQCRDHQACALRSARVAIVGESTWEN